MKKIGITVAALLAAFAFFACSQAPKAVDTAHNSRNSVNWAGVYTGTIPGADVPGIDVRLTLNQDGTFELQYVYQGKPDVFTSTGTFTWDDAGSRIALDISNTPPYYRVGENRLVQLDMEGNEITGDLAEHYILRKAE